jgi:hypothetical protein
MDGRSSAIETSSNDPLTTKYIVAGTDFSVRIGETGQYGNSTNREKFTDDKTEKDKI